MASGWNILRSQDPAQPSASDVTPVSPTGDAPSSLRTDDINHDAPASSSVDPIKPSPYLQADFVADDLVSENARPDSESRPHRSPESTTISGPSFLGLADTSESDQTTYLLDDDAPRRRGGWFLFSIIAIAFFIGIGWLEWNTFKTGRLAIPFIKTAQSQPESKPAPPPPQNPNSQAAANAAVTSQSGDANPPSIPAAANANESGTPANQSSTPTTPNANESWTPVAPDRPSDTVSTEAAQSRQAKDADHLRADAPTTASSDDKSSAAKDSTPSATPAPDPNQNKMLLLGEKYLYGRGVARNCQQAMVYFRAAADENNAPAMSHLGAIYNTGECVPQDRARAYYWLGRAHDADPSNEWITRDMNMLWRDMSTQERASIAH